MAPKDVVDEGLNDGVSGGILVVDGRHKWRCYTSHGDRAGVGRPWRAVGGQRGGQLAFEVQVMAWASQVLNVAVGGDVAYSAVLDRGGDGVGAIGAFEGGDPSIKDLVVTYEEVASRGGVQGGVAELIRLQSRPARQERGRPS